MSLQPIIHVHRVFFMCVYLCKNHSRHCFLSIEFIVIIILLFVLIKCLYSSKLLFVLYIYLNVTQKTFKLYTIFIFIRGSLFSFYTSTISRKPSPLFPIYCTLGMWQKLNFIFTILIKQFILHTSMDLWKELKRFLISLSIILTVFGRFLRSQSTLQMVEIQEG